MLDKDGCGGRAGQLSGAAVGAELLVHLKEKLNCLTKSFPGQGNESGIFLLPIFTHLLNE